MKSGLLKIISVTIGYTISLAIGIYSIWLLLSQKNSIPANIVLYTAGGLVPYIIFTIARNAGFHESNIYKRSKWALPYIYALFVIICILIYGTECNPSLVHFNKAICYIFSYICIG